MNMERSYFFCCLESIIIEVYLEFFFFLKYFEFMFKINKEMGVKGFKEGSGGRLLEGEIRG